MIKDCISICSPNSPRQFKLYTILLSSIYGMVELITRFNPPKPGLQFNAICGAVCIINSYSTLLN